MCSVRLKRSLQIFLRLRWRCLQWIDSFSSFLNIPSLRFHGLPAAFRSVRRSTKRQRSVAMLREFVFSLTLPQTRHEIPRLRARSTATCNARQPLSFRSRTWIEKDPYFYRAVPYPLLSSTVELGPLVFPDILSGRALARGVFKKRKIRNLFTRTISRVELISQRHSDQWIHVNRRTFGLLWIEKSTVLFFSPKKLKQKSIPFPASFRSAAQAPPDRSRPTLASKTRDSRVGEWYGGLFALGTLSCTSRR